jgi:hypothetical protein
MKVIENITLYKCDYCGKKYQKKHFCEAHELKCASNPANYMACTECDHAEKREMKYLKEIELLGYGGGVAYDHEERSMQAFWCIKKEHWIYPPTKVNNPISSEDIENEIANEPMPIECNLCSCKYLN